MWNVIPYSDFHNLIVNYDSIDFSKFDVSLFRQAENNVVAQAIFDSQAKVYYIHYHQDVHYHVPTVKAIDVFYDDIIAYTRDAIERRLERMQGERPIFLFETRSRNRYYSVYTESDVLDFINIKTPYEKVLLVNNPKFKDYPELVNNTHILYYEDKRPDLPPDTTHMAIQVYNKFKSIFDK
jgi:hypothetical protein